MNIIKLKHWFIVIILSFQTVNAYTESLVDFSGASIDTIQMYVDSGLLNYETIARVYLERIETYNDDYQAIISVNKDVIEEAKALDKEYQEKGRRSVMHGIPVLVKDNIDVKGLPTTAGAKGLIHNIAQNDAPIIKNLRDQGALIIAKANMDEFAFHSGMSYSSFGLVGNAYDLEISSYGSSGGTAAGVAADLAVVGIGTDTGTSIRIPSSANNLYGLRPTKDSLSNIGMIPFESLRDTAGPMTKYAQDAAYLYHMMKNDEFILQDIKGIRIGVVREKVDESSLFIQNLINQKIEDIKELGIEIVDVPVLSLQYEFDASNLCYEFNQYILGTKGPIQSLQDLIDTKDYISYISSYGGKICDVDNHKSESFQSYFNVRTNNIAKANRYFETHKIDAILYPPLNKRHHERSNDQYVRAGIYSSLIAPQTGFPSISIPIGFHEGLPYGVEILSTKDQDDLLLSIAIKLDEAKQTYVLPKISPALYKPLDEIQRLLEIIEVQHDEEIYQNTQENIRHFLGNYTHLKNRKQTAQNLIQIYENIEYDLKREESIEKELEILKNKTIIYGTVEVGLVILFVVIRKKNYGKRK